MSAFAKLLNENPQPVTIREISDKEGWYPRVVLETFIHCVPDSKTYSGYADSRQVIAYFKDGEEIARFKDGDMTYTPKFKQLCHELVNKTFATAPEASYGFPHGAVSASKVGGNDLTAGETAPLPMRTRYD
jgi:hypothetical protein